MRPSWEGRVTRPSWEGRSAPSSSPLLGGAQKFDNSCGEGRWEVPLLEGALSFWRCFFIARLSGTTEGHLCLGVFSSHSSPLPC